MSPMLQATLFVAGGFSVCFAFGALAQNNDANARALALDVGAQRAAAVIFERRAEQAEDCALQREISDADKCLRGIK